MFAGPATIRMWQAHLMIGLFACGTQARYVHLRHADIQGRVVRTFRGHTSYIMCVACHPLSTLLVSGGFDETIRLWDLQRGTCHRTIAAHSEAVTGVDFSSDGAMIASCSNDGLMYVRCELPTDAAAYGTHRLVCVCARCSIATRRRSPRCSSRRRRCSCLRRVSTAPCGSGTWPTRAS